MITYNVDGVKMPKIKKRDTSAWIRKVAASHGRKVGEIGYMFVDDEKILEVNNECIYLAIYLHCKYEQRKICSGYEASMGCFYIALINHCILHRGVDLLMSQQFLYLLDRHPFIYGSCCHSSTEFMRMDSL